MNADTPQAESLTQGGRQQRRVWLVGLVVAAALSTWWAASLRMPCGPAAGHEFSGASAVVAVPAEKSVFRLTTFNIHGGRGPNAPVDLNLTAAVLADQDFVGLNEVRGPWLWQSEDQSELLGRQLSLAWLFAPAEERYWHYRFGNGVLSKLPVRDWQRIPLPSPWSDGYRNAVRLALDVHSTTLNVVVTHLTRSDDRERHVQLEAVGDLFLSLAEPAVLMGDLNTTRDDPALQKLLTRPGVVDALGDLPAGRSQGRIDWILTRGLNVAGAGVKETAASDHPMFWIECEMPARILKDAKE
ncbi:MAG: endonuclease/exonuclease/phosphatase family protein [Planctomycetes bacterium]|nr:endonuclease/exonuclease/phosphatase family protein [Planctomycetota bacterium]